MAKRLLLIAWIALAGCGVATPAARAKGVGTMASPEGVIAGANPYRYVALFPNYQARFPKGAEKLNVVEQVDRDGGRVARWWYLRGAFFVPAVAYDGSGGGLSADGRTLVLSRFSWEYPPKTTRLAILDTDLYLNHPRRGRTASPAPRDQAHRPPGRLRLRRDFPRRLDRLPDPVPQSGLPGRLRSPCPRYGERTVGARAGAVR